MSKNSLDALRPALDRMTEAQQAVFSSLSPEEIDLAAKIQTRLDAVSPEVEGQANNTNNLC
ncbi:hypothetical protein OG394_39005 [Kribbella sp. NBC_01245]|uniref:aroma-sacti cluster domain-containing protein n=1 Tax=Kribbella sp. NBC_01245 TaxID=2903578 RepID=UPI002E2A4154|nr:aroma-sacti cluster domain-containing protein [Kribbella sp. NBC_01245]